MHGERKPVVETRDRMGWRASTAGALPHHSGEAGSPFFTFFPFLFFQRGDLFIYHKRFTGVFRLSNIITQGESSAVGSSWVVVAGGLTGVDFIPMIFCGLPEFFTFPDKSLRRELRTGVN